MTKTLRFIPLAVLLLFFIVTMAALISQTGFKKDTVEQTRPLPAIALPVLGGEEGKAQSLTSVTKRPYLLNFFASWCVPCIYEHELLKHYKSEYQIPLVGVSWRNDPADAKKWLKKRGNPYDKVFFDRDNRLGIELGLSGVPESFIVNREGEIILHYKGVLTKEIMEKLILPHFRKAQKQ